MLLAITKEIFRYISHSLEANFETDRDFQKAPQTLLSKPLPLKWYDAIQILQEILSYKRCGPLCKQIWLGGTLVRWEQIWNKRVHGNPTPTPMYWLAPHSSRLCTPTQTREHVNVRSGLFLAYCNNSAKFHMLTLTCPTQRPNSISGLICRTNLQSYFVAGNINVFADIAKPNYATSKRFNSKLNVRCTQHLYKICGFGVGEKCIF